MDCKGYHQCLFKYVPTHTTHALWSSRLRQAANGVSFFPELRCAAVDADGAQARSWPGWLAEKTFLTRCVGFFFSFSLRGQGGVIIVPLAEASVLKSERKNVSPVYSNPSALQKTSAVTVTTSALLPAAAAAAAAH